MENRDFENQLNIGRFVIGGLVGYGVYAYTNTVTLAIGFGLWAFSSSIRNRE